MSSFTASKFSKISRFSDTPEQPSPIILISEKVELLAEDSAPELLSVPRGHLPSGGAQLHRLAHLLAEDLAPELLAGPLDDVQLFRHARPVPRVPLCQRASHAQACGETKSRCCVGSSRVPAYKSTSVPRPRAPLRQRSRRAQPCCRGRMYRVLHDMSTCRKAAAPACHSGSARPMRSPVGEINRDVDSGRVACSQALDAGSPAHTIAATTMQRWPR